MFKTDGPVLPPNKPIWRSITTTPICQCRKCCPSSEDLLYRLQRILEHQLDTNMHPLTCGNDSKHNVLIPMVVDSDIHLRCRDCDWVQIWNPIER